MNPGQPHAPEPQPHSGQAPGNGVSALAQAVTPAAPLEGLLQPVQTPEPASQQQAAHSTSRAPASADQPATAAPIGTKPGARAARRSAPLWLAAAVALLAAIALLASSLLWQKVTGMQEALARQSADTGLQAMEARAGARQAQDLSRETAARLAVMDIRLSEVALQRTQLDELIQSLSRSRDENLVVDIDSAIRLALQQAQLAGSVQPMLAALKAAELRVQRAAQPRLASLQRALARDVDRVRSASVTDTPALLVKLDEVIRLVDELPVANAVATATASGTIRLRADDTLNSWWARALQVVVDEIRGLVRVSRVDHPDAALLNPEQTFFLRENLKLRLLNARLGVLSRQVEATRSDLVAAQTSLTRFFDTNGRKSQLVQGLLKQMQAQMQTLELPRLDDTLGALQTAAAGR